MNASRALRAALACALSGACGALPAADFDGSARLLCATSEARDCVPGMPCHHGLADDVGAPNFMRIDFDKRTVAGTSRTTPIVSMDKDERQVLLQGSEPGYGWSLAIDRTSGRFVASLTNAQGAFVMLGACTPL